MLTVSFVFPSFLDALWYRVGEEYSFKQADLTQAELPVMRKVLDAFILA